MLSPNLAKQLEAATGIEAELFGQPYRTQGSDPTVAIWYWQIKGGTHTFAPAAFHLFNAEGLARKLGILPPDQDIWAGIMKRVVSAAVVLA
jgi:hypothetical protein